MKKNVGILKKILWIVFIAVFSLQVGLAVVWAFSASQSVQGFYETEIYVQSIGRRTTDGWHLPGYSVLLFCIRRVFGFAENAYLPGTYLFQAAFSVFCFSEAVRSVVLTVTKRNLNYGYALLAAVYIVTNPMIWQMQFALLPDAMCLAATVILFAKLLELCRPQNSFRLYCLYVVAGALLLTGTYDYRYFYACVSLSVVMSMIAVIRLWKKKALRREAYKVMFLTPTVLVLVSMIAAYYPAFVGIDGSYPRYSFSKDLMHRMVLPYFAEANEHYSEEISVYLTEDMIVSASSGETNFYTGFLPALEAEADENAENVNRQMISETVRLHGKDIIKRILKEMAGYLFAPVSFVKYTYHSGNAQFGYNLSRMWEQQPVLADFYTIIGTNGMCIFVLSSLLLTFAELIIKKEKAGNVLSVLGVLMCAVILVTFPKMLFAPIQIDYRVGLFALAAWNIAAVALLLKNPISGGKENG